VTWPNYVKERFLYLGEWGRVIEGGTGSEGLKMWKGSGIGGVMLVSLWRSRVLPLANEIRLEQMLYHPPLFIQVKTPSTLQ